MSLSDQFRAHAENCRKTRALSKERQTRNTWIAMAERWLRAATHQAEIERQAAASRAQRRKNRAGSSERQPAAYSAF
jgi:hypothetical protein